MGSFEALSEDEPLVIGHRGASGSRPEHTLEAYKLAIEQGADFIEPDLVVTRDGVLIARHENVLAQVALDDDGNIMFDDAGNPVVTQETSNVTEFPEFADRLTVKMVDGVAIGGWFTEDFTLEEIKELLARERIPEIRPDNTAFNDLYEIPTLAEVIQLVKDVEAETGRKIGIYPETKHPTFFQTEGTFQNEDANGNGRLDDDEDINGNGRLDVVHDGDPIHANLGDKIVETLIEEGFTDPDRIFIQSFEFQNLIALQAKLDELAHDLDHPELADIPLVQLYGAFTDPAEGGFDQPYDIRFNIEQGATRHDLIEIYGEAFVEAVEAANDGAPITAETGYGDLAKPEVLHVIAEQYAEGIGPWNPTIIPRDEDGVSQDPTDLVEQAHDAGLLVHPYTFRIENQFLPAELRDGEPIEPNRDGLERQLEQFIELGIDGFFTDNPDVGRDVVDEAYGGPVEGELPGSWQPDAADCDVWWS